jgi:hypothetical protein
VQVIGAVLVVGAVQVIGAVLVVGAEQVIDAVNVIGAVPVIGGGQAAWFWRRGSGGVVLAAWFKRAARCRRRGAGDRHRPSDRPQRLGSEGIGGCGGSGREDGQWWW